MIIWYELVPGKMEFPHSFIIFSCFYTDYVTLWHFLEKQDQIVSKEKKS